METIVETKASSILQFLHGLQGELHVTWEEGTWAAWLYDLLQPQVQEVVVCNPRRNALLKEGSKSDKVDARKLADLLRTGILRPVYHGENGLRTLRELARSYQTISKDFDASHESPEGAVSRFPVPALRSMPRAIGKKGWGRLCKPGCGAERSYSINSWMGCRPCGEMFAPELSSLGPASVTDMSILFLADESPPAGASGY